jgi:MFS family permease
VKAGKRDAAMRVVIIGRLIGLPAMLLMPLMPTGELALAMFAINFIVLGGTGAANNSILQIISPNRMRGQITAIFFLFFTLVGQGLSPFLIGLVTDLVFKDEHLLRYAILAANVLFSPAALFVLWLGMKPFAREVERLEAAGVT